MHRPLNAKIQTDRERINEKREERRLQFSPSSFVNIRKRKEERRELTMTIEHNDRNSFDYTGN